MPDNTILSRLHHNARVRPNAAAYHQKINGQWQVTNWQDYNAQVRQVARSLMALGLQPGDKACILGFNRPEWVVFDLGCMLAGGVPAGIYTTNAPNEVRYVIDHADASIVLVENQHQWEKINQERQQLPRLKHVIMMKTDVVPDDPLVMSWETFTAHANAVPEEAVDRALEALKPEQLAMLVYTSGTTGAPKGVMLSHHNLFWTSKTVGNMFGINSEDSALSYLPLSHIAEQMFTIHGAIYFGFEIYYAESPQKVPENLKEVQPTVLFGVPRVWERFYEGVTDKLKESSFAKRMMVAWAMNVGQKVANRKNRSLSVGPFLSAQYKLADKLIYSKIKPELGLSNATTCITGAAPIDSTIQEFMAGLGVILHEVYGLSEGTSQATFNQPGKNNFDTVGPPLPGVDVKIATDGEILVKGPIIFMGYYKDPVATEQAFTADGWFRTGDIGLFDADGFVTITGRKKDIIITSGGKNIAPANIESALSRLELLSQVVVIGEGRRYLTALITLRDAALEKFAQLHNLDPVDLHMNPKVQAAVEQGIAEINNQFARVEQIKKFHILPRNFTIEDGELTPTLKLRRSIVFERFAAEIDSMYG